MRSQKRFMVLPTFSKTLVASFALSLAVGIPSVAAIETPVDLDAKTVLGAEVSGPNWKVEPEVGTDGLMRQFTVSTPYGEYDVLGQRRVQERFRELRALDTLEKMSKAETFADAVGTAGLAPIKFGRDLILNPFETTGRVIEGVANTVERVGTEINRSDQSRDGFVSSVTGVQKAKRELAFSLGVDPYTEFKPLAQGLDAMAEMMALGNISVTAAISAIPGGAGVAVSATSTAGTLSTPVRDKSSAEIAAIVSEMLVKLSVTKPAIDAFLMNKSFTPADQLAIGEGLTRLAALNTAAFVAQATRADSLEAAKFERDRIELIVQKSELLGGAGGFVVVGDTTLLRNREGALVALMPYDQLAWTNLSDRTLTPLRQSIAKMNEKLLPILATPGPVTAAAEEAVRKQGWRLVRI